MKILSLIITVVFLSLPNLSLAVDIFSMVDPHPENTPDAKLIEMSWGQLDDNRDYNYDWPFEHNGIGHSISSYQNYGYSNSSAYFHHGIDIMGRGNQVVRSSTAGKIVNIENYYPNDLYWEVAVLDTEGFLWQYHHIHKSSITAEVREAYNSGREIEAGMILGEIVPWPVSSFGEIFHHVHLNVLDGNGHYVNPLIFLRPLEDLEAPQIVAVGLIKNGRVYKKQKVTTPYSLYLKSNDLMLHSKYKIPPYMVQYSIDGGEFKTVWRFDNLPGGGDNEQYVNDYYLPNLTSGNYSRREFLIDLAYGDPQMIPSTVGTHQVEVVAYDFSGNSRAATFNWEVQ